MDYDTIRRLASETRGPIKRGRRLKAVNVRLPDSIRARLHAAAEESGLTHADLITAGLVTVLPTIAARPASNTGAAGAGADAVSAPALESEDV